MSSKASLWVGIASVGTLMIAAEEAGAQAHQVELIDDTRFVQTMGSDSDQFMRYHERETRDFGQDFDATAGHQGVFGGAEARQQVEMQIDGSSAFELAANLSLEANLDGVTPSSLETHYADAFMDLTLSTDVPIAYEAVVELSSAGQSHIYFRGLELTLVDEENGVYEGTGILDAGEHRLRSWGYASTMTGPLNDLDDLTPEALVSGGSAVADIMITGHTVPAPAAVGPGGIALALLMMARRRRRCTGSEAALSATK